jgi:catechol 2,3-dioxygenase
MPLPKHIFDPPFDIVRVSHVRLRVTDLARSRAFYEGAIGLIVEDADAGAVHLRGLEELQHHSLVLEAADAPACAALGFRVASEGDLDRAADWAAKQGLPHGFVERPFQGRTLALTDRAGNRLELVAGMERRERLLQQYGRYHGVHPQRLDHFNVFAPEVQASLEAYAALGFRVTEYAEEDGPEGRIAAGWMHRKGNVHDMAFTNGRGPRLHHFAYWAPTALNIIHLCDLMASTGWLANMERGPGRHGISNAFFLYVRDPDGHRLEIYSSDYQTMDPDHPPLRWSLRDPRRQTLWGAPAPRSWFEEGSAFVDSPQREPAFVANVIVAN